MQLHELQLHMLCKHRMRILTHCSDRNHLAEKNSGTIIVKESKITRRTLKGRHNLSLKAILPIRPSLKFYICRVIVELHKQKKDSIQQVLDEADKN